MPPNNNKKKNKKKSAGAGSGAGSGAGGSASSADGGTGSSAARGAGGSRNDRIQQLLTRFTKLQTSEAARQLDDEWAAAAKDFEDGDIDFRLMFQGINTVRRLLDPRSAIPVSPGASGANGPSRLDPSLRTKLDSNESRIVKDAARGLAWMTVLHSIAQHNTTQQQITLRSSHANTCSPHPTRGGQCACRAT